MKKIVARLRPESRFLEVGEIPALIADALHPEPLGDLMVERAFKSQLLEENQDPTDYFDNEVSPIEWEQFSAEWLGLDPAPTFPMAQIAWERHAAKLNPNLRKCGYLLAPLLTNSRFKVEALRKHCIEEHRRRLEQAVEQGRVKLLDEHTRASVPRYRPGAIISFDELKIYCAQFEIEVTEIQKKEQYAIRPNENWDEAARRLADQIDADHQSKGLTKPLGLKAMSELVEPCLAALGYTSRHDAPYKAGAIKRNALQGGRWERKGWPR